LNPFVLPKSSETRVTVALSSCLPAPIDRIAR
jgi:hypothetical protein